MVFIDSQFVPESVRVQLSLCTHIARLNSQSNIFSLRSSYFSYTNRFNYTARKNLLDRVAFGLSRSTLRQQDAKVNVSRLRQRMTSLRARAVELVGEAFSGGAEDPTALQLQADELYGMEEVGF